LTIAGKKASCHAKVAWRKRNLVRRIETQTNYGPRKRLTVTCRKTTGCATVAWHSENFVRKDCTRAKDERVTQRVRLLRKNLRMDQERKCGTKDLCGGQPLYLRMEETTMSGIGG
jgi:hypothetical protein